MALTAAQIAHEHLGNPARFDAPPLLGQATQAQLNSPAVIDAPYPQGHPDADDYNAQANKG